jgi:hypothetical protein
MMDDDEEDEDTVEDCDDADDDDSITDLISLSAPFGSSMELLPFVREGKYRDGLSAFTLCVVVTIDATKTVSTRANGNRRWKSIMLNSSG